MHTTKAKPTATKVKTTVLAGRVKKPAAGTVANLVLIRPFEAAQLVQCSVGTVYKMAAQGILPSVRIGNMVRFPKEKLLQWLSERESGGSAA